MRSKVTNAGPKSCELTRNGDHEYECLVCRNRLRRSTDLLICPACRAQYPVIASVPILVFQPEYFLAHSMQQLQASRRLLQERAVQLETILNEDLLGKIASKRLRGVVCTQSHFLELFEKSLQPVERFLNQSCSKERVSVRQSQVVTDDPGWQPEMLLPYMLRDWKCDKELESAVQLISTAVTKHIVKKSGASLLVSGCGAGGLLYHLATAFERAVGLDLCLPIILILRELLLGKQVNLKIFTASSRGARVVNTTIRRLANRNSQNIELIVGNSCKTAFPSASIDCVITSFLIDLVEDPRELAAEIHRLLSDRGVWINYGPSGSLDSTWYFDHVESAEFLKANGFRPLQITTHRTTHLNRRELDEFASFEEHCCYLFVAKKSG